MGCYCCGSAQGEAFKLCPKCNTERLIERQSKGSIPNANGFPQAYGGNNPSSLFLIALICVFTVGLYYVLFFDTGPKVGVQIIEDFLNSQ